MFKAFKLRKRQPPIVPTDQVVPLGWFDDTLFTGNAVFQSAFLFDNALDTSKLRNSLECLVNRDGWHKLGSRLRRNVSVAGRMLVLCLTNSHLANHG